MPGVDGLDWDGRGLPPAAQARLQRAADDRVRASFLTVPSAVGVAAAGFEPVGEAMGCVVMHLGWSGYGCPMYAGYGGGFGGRGFGGGGFGGGGFNGGFNGGIAGSGGIAGGYGWGESPTVTSGGAGSTVGGSQWSGYRPYADALYQGYDTALARMNAEAQALGADGVVGIRLTTERMDTGSREFVALGTAVRSTGATHLSRPFATLLDGVDLAKLLAAGWAPAGAIVGLSIAVRHDDYRTQQQRSSWSSSNVEVVGYTELVTAARVDARDQFARRVAQTGAEGAVVDAVTLHVHEVEPSDGHRDHVAEAMVMGTAITRFHEQPTAPTRSLAYLPLTDPSSTSAT